MNVDDIKRYTVMLGNFGSGVLYQANANGDVYVLTAKHNLDYIKPGEAVKITFNTYQDNSWGSDQVDFLRVDDENCFAHLDKNCDAVILILPSRPGYGDIVIQSGYENKLDYKLCGYPLEKTKLGEPHEFAFKSHNIEGFSDSKNFFQGAITKKNEEHENLMGISGGGLFGVAEHYLVLLGIQSEIARSTHAEGEFDYVPICHFNEIIESAPKSANLELLLPGFMKDLLSLGSSIMELKECFIPNFKATVQEMMKEKISNIKHSALEIIASPLKEKMLVSNEHENAYQSKALWSSWLEYLLILTIAGKDTENISALETLSNSFRLIHSETEDPWQMIMENILKTDYSEQAENSIVLVSTRNRPSRTFTIDKGMLGDISREANYGMNIDQVGQLSNVRKFIHIKAFETECIERNEPELSKLTGLRVNELMDAIKTKFNEFLSN